MIHSSFNRRIALAALLFLSSLASGLAVDNSTLLPQEQAIATYMINNPDQGRPTMIFDPVIESVARAMAKDMAVRNYFGDVNPDGVAANSLLRQAGYQLPASWSTAPTTNNVSSIAAGYSTPAAAWGAWMNSPPHKTHLLAQNSFYAAETHYGVGYYYDATSTYQYYWVVVTAPPPPLGITTPAPAAEVTTPSIAVAGTTDPSTNAASVQFRVENANGVGAYQAAAGVANWSGTASGIVGGANVIRAQSLDASGNVIDETTCSFTYLLQGTLTVSVTGNGAVTPAYVGVTSQPVGEPITLKAAAAPGSIFAGWTGSIVSGSPSLTFPMSNGVGLQANFEPSPFPAFSGPYYGILLSGSGAQSGMVHIAVTSTGLFTGLIQYEGGNWSFHGKLDASGNASITVPRRGKTPLSITFQVVLNPGDNQVTGDFSDGATTFSFTGNVSTYNRNTNAAPQAGRYTLDLSPDLSLTGSSAPQGSGYATIVIRPDGGATVAGCLADGTPYSTTGHVANDATLALYWHSAAGTTLNGLLTFLSTNVSDLDGTLTWSKSPKLANSFLPPTFTAQLPCTGSLYTRPATGPGSEIAGFGGGNIAQPIAVPVIVSQTGRVSMATPGLPDVTLAISSVSGVVTGSFVPPGARVPCVVRGVVIQKQQAAFGYFHGVNQSGYFSLTPGS